MANVYAWPPVGHVAAEWSQIAPVGRSKSLITGGTYVSAAQRRRRVAKLEVSALALGRNGAGYIEVLKRLLDGGVHLVRLWSTPINWHLDDQASFTARTRPMSWIVPPGQIDWETDAEPFGWWTGPGVTEGEATTDGGFPALRVTGLPPNQLAVRPGELITMIGGDTAMALRATSSDDDGVAVIRLLSEISGSGRVVIGTRETGVFEADSIPRAVQPMGQNWFYSWSFTEVFEDEGRGPFTEVDPWK